ncbi:hypothetical protein KA005_68725 [bacterium]|nr:hypothetical protein [bacterium]
MEDDLWNRVQKADVDSAACDFKGCSDRGEYIRCYVYPNYELCPKYITHKKYLKTIQEMRDKKTLRHHPRRK